MFKKTPKASHHLIIVSVLLVFGVSSTPSFFLVFKAFHWSWKFLISVPGECWWMLNTTNCLMDLTRWHAAMSRVWDFATKVKRVVGIVAPTTAPGVKSGNLPPGLLKLSLILEIYSSSKSTRHLGVSIHPDFNGILVSREIAICVDLSKNAVTCAAVNTIVSFFSL